MRFSGAIWGLDDDPNGNLQHIAEHSVTKERGRRSARQSGRRRIESFFRGVGESKVYYP